MIITTKNGDMVDTVHVKYAVESDMYITATVQVRICDTGKKQLEVSTRKLAKKRSTIYDSSSSA